MAGRQSHGRAPDKKPKAKNNSKKRSLDAFAIALHENPDRVKIRQSRLGAQEGGSSRPNKNKRRRDEDDDEDEEEEEEVSVKKQKVKKGRFDELDVDEGSDSEGNEWKLGQVDSEDDSDLDSDKAFGESDEERFDGFAFSGGQDKRKKTKRDRDVNLDEEDEEDSDSELEEGDMGEDAVDMATYLDMVDAEEAEEREKAGKGKGQDRKKDTDDDMFGSESEEEENSEESDDASSESSSDEDDDALNPEKIAALDQMIESIPHDGDYKEVAAKRRNDYNINSNAISMAGLPSSKKKVSQDLDVVMADPSAKESKSSKKKLAPSKVPLEKRQQDRLDRSAAYEKSKETLDRWTDTVKHNRRADHLMFPLHDNEIASAHANKSLMPANLSKPFNELEATIQSILEESGLATADGKDDEDKIREFEELETKKMSLEEVKERRDQLRMARELMFREEAKSKRIKKIKSKSYRKVHRKQREKQDRLEKEALLEGGFEPSEDEMEKQDRRRAEERMGAKHRESKWAKAMKGTGRAAWDEDARSGITEMARREEELRKRVEGRAVRKEFENDSDESLSDSDDDSNEDDDSGTRKRLLQNLKGLRDSDLMDESLPGANLANMDFMRKADAARRKQNDAAAEELRRELAGEETPSEEEDGDIGRRIFGPGSHAASQKKAAKLDEFEERVESDDEAEPELQIHGTDNTPKQIVSSASKPSKRSSVQPNSTSKPERHTEGGAWSKVTSKSTVVSEAEAKRRRHKKNDAIDVEELDLSKAAVVASKPKTKSTKKKPAKKSTLLDDALSGSDSDSENEDDSGPYLPFALRDQDLIKRAFAGADVVGEFEAEKKQIIEDEDEKVVDNTLPGWGSWVGDGLSKKENKKNSGRFLTKVDGIKADKRKDAKLDKVIINERRIKKNSKYLATTLPHTFETQQQYERALRLPIGPQWSTKETFQDATKPRVMVKQGIIAPMSKPLF
ncbi:Utp14 protein-domain-containing protein [Leptodontidium sp. MPI-SDFR-AT-0119]|nr:Utp14 protein-domain-containing protein [Leptodontidium sp. MPI-SDFR-AT-0119]